VPVEVVVPAPGEAGAGDPPEVVAAPLTVHAAIKLAITTTEAARARERRTWREA
jgi:hypothetical protein